MRGPKPKPTAQKLLEGNPGKRPVNADEPQLPAAGADFDAAPPELKNHPHAIAEWNRLAPLLRQAAAITAGDRSALLALCLEWDRYLSAMAEIAKLGLVIQTKTGYPMANPYLPVATKALAACNRLWPELGLTPSSRARIKTAPIAPGDDAFAEFDLPMPPSPSSRPQ
jgi:P27 family predicted phage terminase small subunit